jgi:predicted CXXCH cytochrome family protein
MKRVLGILTLLLLAAAGGAFAQVAGTPHDLSAALPTTQRICVFCHTPHGALSQTPAATSQYPLWNHTLSTNTFTVYDSATMNATPTPFAGTDNSSSALCMSCHDGSVGIGSLVNNPNLPTGGEETPTNVATLITGNANLGTDLSNDHPVNFTYDTALATADGGLVDPATSPTIQGWLIGGTVQCASCHDPHDNTNFPFLNATNIGSALCSTCHLK